MEIKLRKPKISDIESFREVFNDKEVVKQLSGYVYPLSPKNAKNKLQEIINLNKKEDHYEFAILYNNLFVELICLEEPSKDKKTFTLGYAIGRKYWNKGIASEAVKEVINFGFKKLKLKKIVADNDKDNPASARVLEKNGFKLAKKANKKVTNILFWEREK